jgi:hypothetical protein
MIVRLLVWVIDHLSLDKKRALLKGLQGLLENAQRDGSPPGVGGSSQGPRATGGTHSDGGDHG